MALESPRIRHRWFAAFYSRVAEPSNRRRLAPVYRDLLSGLHGAVVEIGAGSGATFGHYPPDARVTAFEPDKRIVGVKNVSMNERYLWRSAGQPPVLPPTILTEAVAQVGAILILSKPENREKLIFFMSIERVRYRRPARAGESVAIEAVVRRLRSRMGVLSGQARVGDEVICRGTMTFALGPRPAPDAAGA